MNIDELKTAWKAYDRKIQSSQLINEKIIISMITDRTSSRFVTVKRNYTIGIIWMVTCFGIGLAVLFGNPFDYKYAVQYVPIIIYCICLSILIVAFTTFTFRLNRISINHHNLGVALEKIVAVYERPRKFLKYTLVIFLFSQLFLFPLSFLPRNMERMELWSALAERLIPIFIGVLMLFIAYKLGAFKERYGKMFKEDQRELQELKAMTAELKED